MKIIKKILITSLILIISIFILLQIDDRKSEDTTFFLSKFELETHSDAYFYLLGMHVLEGEDPISEGKRIFKEIQKDEEIYLHPEKSRNIAFKSSHSEYIYSRKLDIPPKKLFCSISRQEKCFTDLSNSPKKAKSIISRYALILDRYKKFLTYTDFSVLTRPLEHGVYIDHAYLEAGHKLSMLEAISLAQSDNIEASIDQTSKNIELIRKNFESVNNLLTKSLFLMHLSENIDLLFLINKKYKNTKISHIEELTTNEKSLKSVLERDYKWYYHILSNSTYINRLKSDLPSWRFRLIYKPNLSYNNIAKYIMPFYKLDTPSYTDIQIAENMASTSISHISEIRNLLGSRVNKVSHASYGQYFEHILELNDKIILFNTLMGKSEISRPDISDTTINNKKLLLVDKKVCTDIGERTNRYNCLQVKL